MNQNKIMIWESDAELFRLVRKELFTALVGDVLDKHGYFNQFLPANIKPISPGMIVIGRAMPVLETDIYGEVVEQTKNEIMKQPFGLMFQAIDDLKRDEVYICSGASATYALWGGLLAMRATKLQAAGAVLNGFSRDTNEILRLNFPTFSLGGYAQDQGPRGKVIDYRIPILFGGIVVNPGDIVFGDRDGVVIIPKRMERVVFEGAFEKAREEHLVKKALVAGMTTVEAFKTFGIM